MDVLMKRSTKIAPDSLSTSYFTGSAFMGISMITLKASGTCLPGETRSRDMVLYGNEEAGEGDYLRLLNPFPLLRQSSRACPIRSSVYSMRRVPDLSSARG